MESIIVFALISLLVTGYAAAYPNGAPKEACQDLKPDHEGASQLVGQNIPFKITTDADVYGEQDIATVTISKVVANSQETFKGFLIVARKVNALNGTNYGEFSPFEDNNSQAVTCSSTRDAITHTNSDAKASVSFEWAPPVNTTGTFVFMGAIVKDIDTYMTGVKSATIRVS